MDTQDDLVFFHAIPSRALTVHWMLEEIGCPYRTHLLDLAKGEHRAPAYLAVNPMGKVPAIVHKGVAITESAAICAYLADEFPHAGLAVPIGTPLRGVYLKWLFFAPGCFEPAVTDRAFQREPVPRTASGYGEFDLVMTVLGDAVSRSPYLLGDRFTAADLVMGANLAWAMFIKAVPEEPPLVAYRDRIAARPAFRKVMGQMAETSQAQGS